MAHDPYPKRVKEIPYAFQETKLFLFGRIAGMLMCGPERDMNRSEMSKEQDVLAGIRRKVAVLLGGSVALVSADASVVAQQPASEVSLRASEPSSNIKLPTPQLILKHSASGFELGGCPELR